MELSLQHITSISAYYHHLHMSLVRGQSTIILYTPGSQITKINYYYYYNLSTLSWHGHKTGKIGLHLTENGSNQRHVIFDGR